MDQLLIVGGGLAGTLLALECHDRGIDFNWVVSEQIPWASFAAYGLCNPVHLRNKVPVWKAAELYETSKTFFSRWSDLLGINAFSSMPVNNLVVDEIEEIMWRQNSESTDLWKYTTGEPEHKFHSLFDSKFISEIRIKEAFYLNIPEMILKTREVLKEHVIGVELEWNEISIVQQHLIFKKRTYNKMILADGVAGMKNPFFQYVPFNPCKGEVLHIKIDGLVIKEAIHKKIVLLPLPNGTYLCGANYEWNNLSNETTVAARIEILENLNIILGGRYKVEVIDQNAGVRPAISDRRPVVGWHPEHSNVGILNGFGTRGLLVGPATCKNLLNNYVNGVKILPDWDVQRFNKRIAKKKE